jgi:hypothetical protein
MGNETNNKEPETNNKIIVANFPLKPQSPPASKQTDHPKNVSESQETETVGNSSAESVSLNKYTAFRSYFIDKFQTHKIIGNVQ